MYIVYHQSLSTIPSKKYSIYTSSINICCCVSKFMRPRSFQQETQLECDCCCWTSYNHTSNICFYKTTFDLIFKCIPSRKCHCPSLLLYHTLYTSNRVMNRTASWQTRVIFQSFDVGWLLLHQPFCCSSYGYHGRRVVVYNSNTSISDVLRDEPEIHKVRT